jgi:hypothetical protein
MVTLNDKHLLSPFAHFAPGRVANPSASHRGRIESRIEFSGAASFAFFFSAKGAGFDVLSCPFPSNFRVRAGGKPFRAAPERTHPQLKLAGCRIFSAVYAEKVRILTLRSKLFVSRGFLP